MVDYLIEIGLQICNLDTKGRTPGHYIGKFSTNIVELTKTLMQHGLNVRDVDKDGLTIASTVAEYGTINQYHYHQFVEFMIESGFGDMFALNWQTGATPLFQALKMLDCEMETIQLILNTTNININQANENGQTFLQWALMYGTSLKNIKTLIELGGDYKLRDKTNEGALHSAVRGSNKEVIKFLITLKFDVNEVDELGETPLHKVRFTISREYLEMTKYLLDIGAYMFAKDKNQNTLAHLFALAENITSDDFQIWVRGMIECGLSDIFALWGNYGRTPLQTAIERLDLNFSLIKLVLESSEGYIDQTDYDGFTLLHLALKYGRSLETIKNLISLGANIKIKNKRGSGILHFAVCGGNTEVIQYFIARGLDVNEKNHNGMTPLHSVIETRPKRYVEVTNLLLDNGADLFSKNQNGDTIAHIMAIWENVSCDDFKIWTTAMIGSGHAHLFTIRETQNDRTPLQSAMARLDLDLKTMKLIIESARLDINQPDCDGNCVLHLALFFGRSLDTIKSLLDLGADWERKGMDCGSVLHFAVMGNNEDAFLYFKSLGADANATDENGETPLHYVRFAQNKDFLGMTRFLLENGANLDAKDHSGKTLDHFMSLNEDISFEEYGVWKEGMIQLGHAAFFQQVSIPNTLVKLKRKSGSPESTNFCKNQ